MLSVPSSQRSSSDAPTPPSWQMSSAPPHVSRHFEVTPTTASASANVVQMNASHDSLARSSEEAGMRLLRPRGAAHRERGIERVAAPNLGWACVGEWFCAVVGGRWTRLPRLYSVSSAMRDFCVLLCAVGNEWEIIKERTSRGN